MNNKDIITTFKKIEGTHDQLTRLSQHDSVKTFFSLLGNKKFNDFFWDGLTTRFESSNSNFWDAQLNPQTMNKLIAENKLFKGVDPKNIDTQKKFSQFLFNLVMKDVGFVANVMRLNNVTSFATSFSLFIHSFTDVEEAELSLFVDFLTETTSAIVADYGQFVEKNNESKKRKNDDDDDTDNSNKPKRPNNDDKKC